MRHQPRKRFGQNFLHDKEIIAAIIASISAKPGEHVIEIGPGQGALTLPLLNQCDALTVIEIDRDLVAALEARGLPNLTVYSADALKLDFNELHTGTPMRIVGNLPYNISTPLLLHFVDYCELIKDITVMLQKEVIDRLLATPGQKTFGRLSVLLQSVFRIEPVISVPPSAFRPAPKVQSGVIKLTVRQEAALSATELKKLQLITRIAFANKRKTLRNNLSKTMDMQAVEALGIDPQCRAETLNLEQFHALARLLPDT